MPRPRYDEACTKIVATVGPATDTVEKLVELIHEGVDVFRINTAHGTLQQNASKVVQVRKAAEESGFHVGVLLDLAGPKIRLGQLHTDPLDCTLGRELSFVRGSTTDKESELTSSYDRLIDELDVNDRVMLADGTVALRVKSVAPAKAVCEVTAAGEVRSRQGINLPGAKLSVRSMLQADVENAMWAAQNEVDFISLSFVRSAGDVRSLKDLLASYGSNAMVIAKIEKPEALDEIDAIVSEADGVMVARGDLGVEIDVARTPIEQKRIIRACRQQMKPVIVATQMLESMHHSRRPTRAEASDVANAVLDGADACMLSGETAIGDHPREAVAMMNRIMRVTEASQAIELEPVGTLELHDRGTTPAMIHAAIEVAEKIQAKMIAVITHSGATAWVKSNTRSLIPTLAISDHVLTVRRMNLMWGIKPHCVDEIGDLSQIIGMATRWGRDEEKLQAGDRIVVVAGAGVVGQADGVTLIHTFKG
ncbi:MAG: pyruvate kinase [Planctomycetota bacterium]